MNNICETISAFLVFCNLSSSGIISVTAALSVEVRAFTFTRRYILFPFGVCAPMNFTPCSHCLPPPFPSLRLPKANCAENDLDDIGAKSLRNVLFKFIHSKRRISHAMELISLLIESASQLLIQNHNAFHWSRVFKNEEPYNLKGTSS